MGRVREVAVATALVLLFLSVPGQAMAFGYVDRGFDPDDLKVLSSDPDIRSTTRKVWANNGHRRLTVTFRSFEPLGLWWSVNARLDTRGGPLTDYRMIMSNSDIGGTHCSIRPTSSWEHRPGTFLQDGSTASCRIPLRYVHPNKRIRWKFSSSSGYGGGADIAPDGRGWFD